MNKLILNNGEIILEGFTKLESKVTFAFYTSGIVIFLTNKESNRKNYYFDAEVINHKIYNSDLYDRLKERLPENINSVDFVFAIDSYIQQF